MPAKATKKSHFSRRLRELRKARGLSVYALAKIAGITDQAIANIERGAVPSLPTAVALGAALGAPIRGDLIGPEIISENPQK